MLRPAPHLSSWQPSQACHAAWWSKRSDHPWPRSAPVIGSAPPNCFSCLCTAPRLSSSLFFFSFGASVLVSLGDSHVHALVLQEIITARKCLTTFARERWPVAHRSVFTRGHKSEERTFLVRVQRQHVSLQVFRARKALRAARHRTDVRALACFGRFGHASAAALLDEMRDWHGRWDAWTAQRGTMRLW
jgi:hypothetical protein